MVVQHNLQAINSNRMLGITQGTLSNSTEKLSSGYKINRAADNAAGLTISEKMRKQIRGLTQASTNAEDGVSAVQTAEGALTEVHDMLQRMNELAVQAANGTNSESDRQAIQDEIDQLVTEVDRVSETTKFNEIYLLKGNSEGTTEEMKVNAHDAGIKGTLLDKGNTAVFSLGKALEDGDKINVAGEEYTIGGEKKQAPGEILDPRKMRNDTDGYVDYDTTANFGDVVGFKAGDSFTVNGETYTMTDKIALDEIEFTTTGDVTTFQIGERYYQLGATNDYGEGASKDGLTSANAWTVDEETAKKLIKKAIDEEQQVTITDNATIGGVDIANPTQVVLEHAENEIFVQAGDKLQDLAKKVLDDAAYTMQIGDSYTKINDDGEAETIIGVENPQSAKATYTAIKALADDDYVILGTAEDAKKYTIIADDEEEDLASYKLHKDTILSMIHDGDVVGVNSITLKTVIGDIGVPESEENGTEEATISAEEAYEKIAEELTKASSIGADEGKEATVESDGEGNFTITKGSTNVTEPLSFNLHVGADADMTNKIGVDINAMSAKGLGIQNLKVVAVDDSGKTINDGGMNATYAVDAIADAIAKVSAQRSALGAVQNRLEHTIKNLDNVVENTTAAESRIRDTDMATEMVRYSNNNILAQAGQSMLAQANQSNQGVLSLLG